MSCQCEHCKPPFWGGEPTDPCCCICHHFNTLVQSSYEECFGPEAKDLQAQKARLEEVRDQKILEVLMEYKAAVKDIDTSLKAIEKQARERAATTCTSLENLKGECKKHSACRLWEPPTTFDDWGETPSYSPMMYEG